jgi:mono/diheme cytochrome c family protein
MNKLKEILNKQLILIKEEPVRAFALLYPYILVIGIALGLYYLSNINSITGQAVPPVLSDTTKVEDLKIVTAKDIAPIDIFVLSQPNEKVIEKGKSLYTTNCVACHGEQGKGDGAGGSALNPLPRNMTSKDGWKNGMKISQLYQTLQEGIAGGGMIAYDFLIPEDRLAIIHYLRSAFIPDAPQDSRDDLTTLDQTYNLSMGMKLSAQIPVAVAEKIALSEMKVKKEKIDLVLHKINDDKSDIGADIFRRVTKDGSKAINTLSASDGWKQSSEKLISTVFGSLNSGGFSNKVNNLSKDEWNLLFNYLVKQI